MTGAPRISILLPVHNGMEYLPLAVESLLAQTYRDFELLVIDNGSSDGVADYARSIQDPRVIFHRLEQGNLVEALKYGLRMSRSELVARMDSDDICRHDRLEKQAAYMASNPACVLLSAQATQIDNAGRVIGVFNHPLSDAALRWQMLFANPFNHMGAMFRRSAVLEVGGYQHTFNVAEDYDLWTRLSTRGRIANLPDRLIERRSHPASVSSTNGGRQAKQAGQISASYAQHLVPYLDLDTMFSLHQFRTFGIAPDTRDLGHIAALFNRLAERAVARQETGPNAELAQIIASDRSALRWRCTQLLRTRWRHPGDARRLLSAARRFDPENGRYRSMADRMVGGLFRSLLASRSRVTAGTPAC